MSAWGKAWGLSWAAAWGGIQAAIRRLAGITQSSDIIDWHTVYVVSTRTQVAKVPTRTVEVLRFSAVQLCVFSFDSPSGLKMVPISTKYREYVSLP